MISERRHVHGSGHLHSARRPAPGGSTHPCVHRTTERRETLTGALLLLITPSAMVGVGLGPGKCALRLWRSPNRLLSELPGPTYSTRWPSSVTMTSHLPRWHSICVSLRARSQRGHSSYRRDAHSVGELLVAADGARWSCPSGLIPSCGGSWRGGAPAGSRWSPTHRYTHPSDEELYEGIRNLAC